MAILVKVSGSSLGKLYYFFFAILNKNKHEEYKGHDMIFLCFTKSVKPAFLDGDDCIRQQPPSKFQ